MKKSFIKARTEVTSIFLPGERALQNDDDGRNGKVDKKNTAQCAATAILLDEMLKYSWSICFMTSVPPFHVCPRTHTVITLCVSSACCGIVIISIIKQSFFFFAGKTTRENKTSAAVGKCACTHQHLEM